LLWGKSLQLFYDEGLLGASDRRRTIPVIGVPLVAGDKQRYIWQIGNTEQHCEDCLRLNGQVHTMKEWKQANWLPKTNRLACKGFRCDCSLIPTDLETKGAF
jgi:hypothetical protein